VLDPTNSNRFLENGTLKVYADIQIYTDTPVVWTPRKRLHLIMSEVFESGQEGDVCFTIGNERFLTFKFLVARRAPILADMAEAVPSGSDIPIDGVDPAMFRALLQFIYTDELPMTVNLEADARTLLEVADQFGCSCLKLLAESEVVKAGIKVENAAELLLFADAHCCALLREAAFDYCVAHPSAVRASGGWTQLKKSPELLDEFFGACFPTGSSSGSDSDTMKVASLRQKLDEKNLDVDGTREMLIQRLKESEETND
jgi:speckle-type POZ protein